MLRFKHILVLQSKLYYTFCIRFKNYIVIVRNQITQNQHSFDSFDNFHLNVESYGIDMKAKPIRTQRRIQLYIHQGNL